MIEKFEVRNRWTGAVQFTAEIETTPDMSMGWKLRLAVIWALANAIPCTNLRLDGIDFTGYKCPVNSSFDDSSFDDSRFIRSSFDDCIFDDSSFDDSSFDGSSLNLSRFIRSSFVNSSFDGSSFDGSSFDDCCLVDCRFDGSSFYDCSFDGQVDARNDFRQIISTAHAEIPALIAALRAGKVAGSTYSGHCACLVGTIANARGVDAHTLHTDSNRPAERWFLMISKGDTPGDNSPGAIAAGKAIEWALEYCAEVGIDIPAEAV
jgi:Pentapeptide repeats (8 copies)